MNEDPMAPTPEDTALDADAPVEQEERNNRIFLCVVDNTLQYRNAIYFAARRTARTGAGWPCFTSWSLRFSTGCPWRKKCARRLAKKRGLSAAILQRSRNGPTKCPLYLRREAVRDDSALIEEEPRISILVLGAGIDKKDPGPLVSSIGGKMSGKFPIDHIVPGNLSQNSLIC